MINTEELAIELKNHLKEAQLRNIYKLYFSKFDTATKKQYASSASLIYITRIIINIFSDKELFNQFFDSLEEPIKTILFELAWKRNFITSDEIKDLFGVTVTVETTSYVSHYRFLDKIEDKFHIFHIEEDYDYSKKDYIFIFSLPKILKKLVNENLKEKPKEYNLLPSNEIEKTDHFFNENNEILTDLPNYIKFLENKPTYLKTNFFELPKISKSDLKFLLNMSTSKKEFFDSKESELMKTTILASFITGFIEKINYDNLDNLQLLKKLIFKTENNPFFIFYNLLFHITGKNTINTIDKETVLKNKNLITSMFFIFREMKQGNWYDFKNILFFINLRNLDVDILENVNLDKLYITYKNEFGDKERKYFSKNHELDTLFTIPLIKAIFFLFSSLGLFDIKYNKNSNDLNSVFDGLKYIKLTELGSYILGLTDTFDFKIKESNTKIIINELNLTILVKGKDKTKTLYLTSFAEKISETMYIVTYESFLKKCASKKDIEDKIKLFKKEVSNNLPKIWNDFFDTLLKRVSNLREEKELVLYNLDTINNELIEIFLKDPIINKLVLKVEGQRIAIYKDDFLKIKKRLEIFGFLI